MTLFEKIEYMARLGKDSLVKTKEDQYIIVSHRRDDDGLLRKSFFGDIVYAKNTYGATWGQSEKGWNEREAAGWKFIGEFPRPEFERFEVGDKVKLIGEDHVYSIASVDDNMIYTINLTTDDSKSHVTVDLFSTNTICFVGRKQAHHDQLTPVFEEEPADKQEEQEKPEQKTITIDGIDGVDGGEYYLTPAGNWATLNKTAIMIDGAVYHLTPKG